MEPKTMLTLLNEVRLALCIPNRSAETKNERDHFNEAHWNIVLAMGELHRAKNNQSRRAKNLK